MVTRTLNQFLDSLSTRELLGLRQSDILNAGFTIYDLEECVYSLYKRLYATEVQYNVKQNYTKEEEGYIW